MSRVALAIAISFLLLGCEPFTGPEVIMGTNKGPLGTVTYTKHSSGGTLSGVVANVNDNNEATYHGCGISDPSSPVSSEMTWVLTFANAQSIGKIRILSLLYSAHASAGVRSISYNDGSSNHSLYSASGLAPEADPVEHEFTINGPVKSVTVYLKDIDTIAAVYHSHVSLYEIEANYYDAPSEFKLSTSGGVKQLAREGNISSPFRYVDSDGVPRSFSLVETTDSLASPIRVKTPSGIKSISFWVE